MKDYKTVYAFGTEEIIINKSKFVAYVIPIETESDAILFIEKTKKKNWNATHNVPVYIIGENQDIQRYSDDGEPSGTAGIPILEMLKKEGMTNVCIVITRYFGGVKLGTGGLVRAYTQSAKAGLQAAQIVDKRIYQLLDFTVDYHYHGKIQNLIMNNEQVIIKDTIFGEKVQLSIYVLPSEAEHFIQELIEITSDQIKINVIGEFHLTIKNGQILSE